MGTGKVFRSIEDVRLYFSFLLTVEFNQTAILSLSPSPARRTVPLVGGWGPAGRTVPVVGEGDKKIGSVVGAPDFFSLVWLLLRRGTVGLG